MNERLKELALQAGFQEYFFGNGYVVRNPELERFADLVRADEREACAEVCDSQQARYALMYNGVGDFAKSSMKHSVEAEGMIDAASECAELIRARSDK
jgi:hypothetical protein